MQELQGAVSSLGERMQALGTAQHRNALLRARNEALVQVRTPAQAALLRTAPMAHVHGGEGAGSGSAAMRGSHDGCTPRAPASIGCLSGLLRPHQLPRLVPRRRCVRGTRMPVYVGNYFLPMGTHSCLVARCVYTATGRYEGCPSPRQLQHPALFNELLRTQPQASRAHRHTLASLRLGRRWASRAPPLRAMLRGWRATRAPTRQSLTRQPSRATQVLLQGATLRRTPLSPSCNGRFARLERCPPVLHQAATCLLHLGDGAGLQQGSAVTPWHAVLTAHRCCVAGNLVSCRHAGAAAEDEEEEAAAAAEAPDLAAHQKERLRDLVRVCSCHPLKLAHFGFPLECGNACPLLLPEPHWPVASPTQGGRGLARWSPP